MPDSAAAIAFCSLMPDQEGAALPANEARNAGVPDPAHWLPGLSMEGISLGRGDVDVRQPSQDALSAVAEASRVDLNGDGPRAGIGHDGAAGYQMLMAAWKILEITRQACGEWDTRGEGLQRSSRKGQKGQAPQGRLSGARTKHEFEAVVCEIVATRKVRSNMGVAQPLQAAPMVRA